MPQHKIAITLPQPCHEDWDQMSPTDKGRHCAMCQKTVIDFTLMNDGEIIDIFSKAEDNPPCGHFLATQLDRNLVDTRYKPTYMSSIAKRVAATLILFQSVTVAALAQQVKKRAPVSKQTAAPSAAPNDNRRIICGTVIDNATNKPVAGIRIIITGTGIGSVTGSMGVFLLPLPDTFHAEKLMLESIVDGRIASNVVMEETYNTADILANKNLVLYSYEEIILQAHDVVTAPYHQPTYSGISVPTYSAPPQKTLWQKITKPFKKKQHANN